ncbi:hypothetical protein C2S53_005580 [Perilla frutescens var. hirtella]|uniref:Reverse transcriptase domain-containing protein n=1 Tax=Perilla frutescens var. hirtella TaxID=608512 RepID=A0AAD4JE96_PERFH|nr:hypothetical protein C2S53_005580 [Perilla frutescens var. hirtella]
MAFLFVDSLAQNNSRFVQISGKILELLLLSMGLISTVVVMKEAVLPYSCELVFSSLMGFWSSITCFLSSPPTIIIMINVMVLLILASSAFYGREPPTHNHHHQTSLLDVDDHDLQIHDHESPDVSPSPPPPLSRDVVEITPPPPRHINMAQVQTTIPIRNNTTTLPQGRRSHDVSSHVSLSPQNFVEKATLPLLLNQALIPKPHEIGKTTSSSQSTEGKNETKVLPPPPLEKWKDVFIENDDQENEEDTMEATWKAITGGGKQKPEKKHLKKSETWNAPPPPPPPPRRSVAVRRLDSEEVLPTSPKWKELRKAETFNDAVSLMRRGGLIRRDPSMSLEEFNQKIEAFIKKSNDNMRLQRQESHQRIGIEVSRKILRNHIQVFKLEVLGIIEPRARFDKISQSYWSSMNLVPVFQNNRGQRCSNIWIFVGVNVTASIIFSSDQCVLMQINSNNFCGMVAVVHGASSYMQQRRLWDDLSVLSGNFLIIGDFNAIRGAHERRWRSKPSPQSCLDFNNFIGAMNVLEVDNNGLFFSWSSRRFFPELCESKIDRALISVNFRMHGIPFRQPYFLGYVRTTCLLWLCQKSRVDWLNDKDRNTKFFHGALRRRRAKVSIDALSIDGEIVHDHDRIATHVVDYFEKLFARIEDNDIDFGLVNGLVSSLIDDRQSHELIENSSFKVVKSAIFELDGNSAAGPDGFSGKFFHTTWEGRQIHEAIVLASEGVNAINRTHEGRNMALKLDITKAFDTMQWSFLMWMMKIFGFPEKFCAWIHTILASARLSVLVNGSPKGYFSCGQGVRQGDPLSPLLFGIAEEMFHYLLTLAVHQKTLMHMSYCRGVKFPTHILYDDYVFLFYRASKSNIRALKSTLELYSKVAHLRGLKDKILAKFDRWNGQVLSMAEIGCGNEKLPLEMRYQCSILHGGYVIADRIRVPAGEHARLIRLLIFFSRVYGNLWRHLFKPFRILYMIFFELRLSRVRMRDFGPNLCMLVNSRSSFVSFMEITSFSNPNYGHAAWIHWPYYMLYVSRAPGNFRSSFLGLLFGIGGVGSQVSVLWKAAVITVTLINTVRVALRELEFMHGKKGYMRNYVNDLVTLKALKVKPRPAPLKKVISVIWRSPPLGSDGSVLGCFHTEKGIGFAFLAEALAVLEALEWARRLSLDFIWLEADSVYVVSLLSARSLQVP